MGRYTRGPSIHDEEILEISTNAACREHDDPDLWFEEDDWERIREAKSICGACPVRPACLAYAVRHQERWGIWGGLTSEERKDGEHREA